MKLCVIPARGGSKRIPRKNIRSFCGKPLIAYSIEAAINARCFDKVIVSTDDNEIADIAISFGAEIPFTRPDHLSDDYVGTIPVISHAINWFASMGEKPAEVCCLYATAPFIKEKFIQEASLELQQPDVSYCFSTTTYAFPIQRALKINSSNRIEMFFPKHEQTRSQDLAESFHDAGQFYWGKADAWLESHGIFSEKSVPYVLPRHFVQDIDNLEDWVRAEHMYKSLKASGEI